MLNTLFAPFPALYTGRLCLRETSPADAQRLFDLRRNTEAMRYIDREPPAAISEIETMLVRMQQDAAAGNGITWALTLKEHAVLLCGTIGFWRIDKPHYRAEIGYMLFPEFQGRGIMSEALAAVLDFGFRTMGLHSVEAHINPANLASAALLQKNGFLQEAYFRENYFFRERFLDTAVYSLVNGKR